MTWVDELAPRDGRTASRVALIFFAAAAVANRLQPVTGPGWVKGATHGLPVLLVLVGAAVVWVPLPWPRYTCTGLALGGLLTTVFLDVITQDAGYSGQTVFLYPVLYAASQLRRAAAWLLAGTTLRLPDGQQITLSVSVGQAHAPANDGSTLDQLYSAADHALYLAKRRGRDQAASALDA